VAARRRRVLSRAALALTLRRDVRTQLISRSRRAKRGEIAGTRVARLPGMKPVLLLLLVACTSRAPTNQDEPPSAALSGELPRHMANCPSAVPTAETQPIRTRRGIDLAITSNDPSAQRAIVAAADVQMRFRSRRWFMLPHTGRHDGPGSVGHCPVIHANTWINVEPIARGVLIHVIARDPNAVQTLQRATLARIEDLQVPAT